MQMSWFHSLLNRVVLRRAALVVSVPSLMEKEKVRNMLTFLYNYYLENTDQMDDEFIRLIKNGEHKDTVVCDYIACMTDRFSITAFKRLFIPTSWNIY